MRPLDPRLLKYAKSARLAICLTAITGLVQAILVILQCIFIAATISPVIHTRATWEQVQTSAFYLILVILARIILLWLRTAHQHRAAKKAIAQLRVQLLEHCLHLGPRWLARKGADTATLATRGLENLGPYFIDYLPQLILAATVTPLTLIVLGFYDLTSLIIAVVTIPLIPVFMVIIGLMTRDASQRRLETMQTLGRQLLDLLAGLATLKALGRHQGPQKQVREIGRTYTQTTMATLRTAFLSGAVLEFLATLSVALIAVSVGLRMVYGGISLQTGLITIMLAPEIYLPLREVGKHYHACADGVAAAEATFQVLETPIPEAGSLDAPDLRHCQIEIHNFSVAGRGSWAPHQINFKIKPGQITALIGKSGGGKTTTVMGLLQQLPTAVTSGEIIIRPYCQENQQEQNSQVSPWATDNEINLSQIANDSWWQQIAWLPQAPLVVPGTLAQNLFDGDPQEKLEGLFSGKQLDPRIEKAAVDSGFAQVIKELPQGYQTLVGQGGIGLSVGQRQRLALMRALLSEKQLIILDEPSAHLDAFLESQVVKVLETLKAQGKTVVVIAHRNAIIKVADQTIPVTAQAFTAEEKERFKDLEPVGAIAQTVTQPGFLSEELIGTNSTPVDQEENHV